MADDSIKAVDSTLNTGSSAASQASAPARDTSINADSAGKTDIGADKEAAPGKEIDTTDKISFSNELQDDRQGQAAADSKDLKNKELLTTDQQSKVNDTLGKINSQLKEDQKPDFNSVVEPKSDHGQDAGRYNPEDKTLTLYADGIKNLERNQSAEGSEGQPKPPGIQDTIEDIVAHENVHAIGDKNDPQSPMGERLKNTAGEDLFDKASKVENSAPNGDLAKKITPYPDSHLVPRQEMKLNDNAINVLRSKGTDEKTLQACKDGIREKDFNSLMDKAGFKEENDPEANSVMEGSQPKTIKNMEDMNPKELDDMQNKMVPYASERPNEFYAESGKECLLHSDRFKDKIANAEKELENYRKGTAEHTYIQGCIDVMRETMDAWKAKMVNQ